MSRQRPTGFTAGPNIDPLIGSAELLEGDDVSEYSWGPGIVPAGYEDALPIEGGRYHGRAPEPDLNVRIARDL